MKIYIIEYYDELNRAWFLHSAHKDKEKAEDLASSKYKEEDYCITTLDLE